MPASIIIADVGERPYVAGSNKHMHVVAPKPGRTPAMVPIKTPIKHTNRLIGSVAMFRHKYKLFMKSIAKDHYIPNIPVGSWTFNK